ncbi:MAG: hypothetical protein J7L82_05860, partial [Staphylothermus sp.]|nr:hypothetical protein [Staphylothermus sp.]
EEAEKLIEKTLEAQGIKYSTKQYGRIKIYKTGLFKKITLIYNYSDSTFQICGNKNILETIKKNRILYTTKVSIYEQLIKPIETRDTISEKAFNLLIKRQETIEKLRYCRTKKRIAIGLAIFITLLLWTKYYDPFLTLTIIAIILLIIILTPAMPRIHGKTTIFGSHTCIKLGKELRKIENELLQLTETCTDENMKKIILLQLQSNNKRK